MAYYANRNPIPDGPGPYSQPPRKRKRGHTAGQKAAVVIISLIYVAVLSAVTYFRFYKPDVKMTDTQREVVTDEYGNSVTVEREINRRENVYNFLLLGRDRQAMLTDVIMLINLDVSAGRVTVMQVPRDTFVTGDGIIGTTSGKANELLSDYYYSNMRNGMSENDSDVSALQSVKELIQKGLAVKIDFALLLDLEGFRNIVDAIGGVEIDVPYDMYYTDPEQNLFINIRKGYQTLGGADAEGFVRFRSNYIQGDLGRVNAQKLFLSSFLSKLKSSVSLTNLDAVKALASVMTDNVTSDLTLSDTVYFARQVLSLDLSSVTMVTLPGYTASYYYVMNKPAALERINASFNLYREDKTEGMMDIGKLFVDDSDDDIKEIYYARGLELYDGKEYSAGGVIESPIEIPLKDKGE